MYVALGIGLALTAGLVLLNHSFCAVGMKKLQYDAAWSGTLKTIGLFLLDLVVAGGLIGTYLGFASYLIK